MRLLIPSLVVVLLAACGDDSDVDVTGAYLKPPIAGRDVAVAYMTVHNLSAAPIVLAGANSTSASSIEFHTHVHDGDMLRMRPVETVTVMPGEAFKFEPGGHHLMVFGFKSQSGDPVAIELQFEDHEPRTVRFEVRARTGDAP